MQTLPGNQVPLAPGSVLPSRRPFHRPWTALLAVAVVGVVAAAAITGAVVLRDRGSAVTVRSPDGAVVATVPLHGTRFALQYRNSIYRTLAEERYRVLPDGRFELLQIATDQLALLEEYYQLPGPARPAPPGDRRNYVADPDPAHPAVFRKLRFAASDLGERTLLVPGHAPVPIWQRVVTQDPTVILDVEEN
jgi:predicted RNA binding protein YcfA (HicA-like mRNA interferase family)